ncbi:EF-hand domain-containing protein [Mesorhizobium sp. CA13]|uniref:EF-hand domain-containing protein n=1 Tax=unclassified Mesorhizobium TaxID=325217 RepID=UPI00112DF7BD|nr:MULTISPECIES: EF-hand domain-containing protein [unclassified Mesorhizobium]MBZ9857412.1 EF-hand domain-containing protein [Mesorhizobium sp. CA13]MBZ9966620.1 EF-hand domain-containing protein [Mesorhizobium sp. BR1-1-2]MCA0014780.1 EF-hand domain-containing protein [Mesorhizobium sp. B294B1A1]MCA0041099.1 EF-hand domain-containing protein [Mesorhizobium sp. B292B1B]TPM42673.1 EF-hand domain-containing protein [Mesorhizobium sp. B2-3-2]
MKRISMALGALLITIGSAAATDRERARELFRQIDTNGDRKLEFNEIAAARARLFDRTDTNHNGVLDPGEIQAAMERAKSTQDGAQHAQLADMQQRKGEMDSNGDGRISRGEFASFVPDRLLKADANGDRALSLGELRSLRRQ